MKNIEKLNEMIDLIDQQWGIVVDYGEDFGAEEDDDEREAIIMALEDVGRALRTVKARYNMRKEREER